MNINTVIMAGRLTRNPELKRTNKGTAVTQISMAVDDGYGDNKKTAFVDVTVWGHQAEFCNNYLKKGSPVLVEGRITMETWTTKDGQNRSKIMVTCENLQSLETRKDASQPI